MWVRADIARRGLSWDSAEVRAMDLRYANLDPKEGVFLQLAAAGHVDGMPSDAAIDAAADEPPIDTRAYLRAHLIRLLGNEMSEMDWDRVRFKMGGGSWYRSAGNWLGMPDPARWGKDEADAVLESCHTPEEFVAAVGEPKWPDKLSSGWGRSGWSYSGMEG